MGRGLGGEGESEEGRNWGAGVQREQRVRAQGCAADRFVRIDRDEDAGGPRVYLLLGGGGGERVGGKGYVVVVAVQLVSGLRQAPALRSGGRCSR